MKKIVVAGAGGYLATNVIPHLITGGNGFIYAFSSRAVSSEDGGFRDRIKYFKLDMEEYEKAGDLLESGCDTAVNFSWIGARGRGQDEDKIQQQNEDRSLKLLNSLIMRGCSHFIQIGSMAEYGIVEGLIDETTECNPITAYAKRKFSCAEKMRVICDSAGIKFTELRMGSMYGNYMGENNIIGFLCREFSEGRKVRLRTTCLQDWEYTHVDDLAEILSCCIYSGVDGGIYNITNSDTHQLRYFLEILESKFGFNGYIGFGDIDGGIGCQNIRCDNTKIKNMFGKSTFIKFETGIDSVIKHYKKEHGCIDY